jgi:hypothetical protein
MDRSEKKVIRRDGAGHLDEAHARRLLEKSGDSRSDKDTNAFLPRPRTSDALSEELGEAFVQSATTGEESEAERHDRVVPDEQGGPFVTTPASDEYASGTDESNISEATREPLPRTSKAEP